jgi:predicted Zn-dependent peptidase
VVTQEPVQHGERRIEVEYDANPSVLIGYHVPNAAHPDAPALRVLASILTGGRTSRLVQRLVVRDRWAAQVSAGPAPGARYPRLFTFSAAPIAPHTTQEIEGAIYEELERIQRDPPTDFEMQRIRNSAEYGSLSRLDNAFYLALQLASSEALWNDWTQTFRDDGAVQRVTAADVQRVARTYFARTNRTVATLVRPPRPAPLGGTN